jgi:uncharacterized protein involved in outer membrane biogenesis
MRAADEMADNNDRNPNSAPAVSPAPRRYWRWLALAVPALVILWTLAGFLLVPWLVKRELPRIVNEQTQHTARIGDVRFNPFTLTLDAGPFAIDDAAGQAVLGFESASIDLQWSSIARRGVVLSALRLDKPFVNVVVEKDGTLNLARLVPAQKSGSTAASPPTAATPRFDIGEVAIAGGRIAFDDRRGGYRNALGDLTLALKNLTTLDKEEGDYALTAHTTTGAKLHWNGTVSLAPLAVAGTLKLTDAALPEFNAYLARSTQVAVASGKAEFELPYRLELPGGEPRFTVSGAKLGVRELALKSLAGAPLLSLADIALTGVDFDLKDRRTSVKSLLLADGQVAVQRDANGVIDIQKLFAPAGAAPATTAAAPASPSGKAAAAPFSLNVASIEVRNIAARYNDSSAKHPLAVAVDGLGARLSLSLRSGDAKTGLQIKVEGGSAQAKSVTAGSATTAATNSATTPSTTAAPAGAASPAISVADLDVTGIGFDSVASAASIERIRLGSLKFGSGLRDGRLDVLDLAPVSKPDPSSRPVALDIRAIELADGSVVVNDVDQRLEIALDKLVAKASNISSDGGKPLGFDVAAQVRSGGGIVARGSFVPTSKRVDTTLQVNALALTPLQPILARYATIKLASGELSGNGTLKGVAGGSGDAGLVYAGSLAVAKVNVVDSLGGPVAGWQSLATDTLRFGFSPLKLDIDEVRWVAPIARFAIAKDGSSNFSRLVIKPAQPAAGAPAPQAPPATAAPASTAAASTTESAVPLSLNVRRVRVSQGRLEFADANVEPEFTTFITELTGTANGLSSARDTRSQFSLDGKVGEFGFARLSGAINFYAPRDRTTFRVELRNIDLATATPYSMRFAGYRIAEGRATLDLNYRVRGAVIEGDNRIVFERLVLGERVESPTALNIPLALAIALLKEPDGSINLDVPVTGSLDDPQFSIGPIIWQAVGNFLRGIVTAPFRMLGRLFGGDSDEAGTILFEPAASRLLPPEREKLARLAALLEKRPGLNVTVPSHFDDNVDARAMRRIALAREVARRSGFAVNDDEAAAPVNADDRRTRAALRALYTERFTEAEWAKRVAEAQAKEKTPVAPAAETKPADANTSAAEAGAPTDAPAKPLSLMDRARNLVTGEPQLADARTFYNDISRRLRESQPLPPTALADLGKARAAAIVEALGAVKVAADRLSVTAPPAASTAAVAAPAARSTDPDARYVKLELSLSGR